MVTKGDVIEIEGEQHTVKSTDPYNQKIHFESGLSIHAAAVHCDAVRVQ